MKHRTNFKKYVKEYKYARARQHKTHLIILTILFNVIQAVLVSELKRKIKNTEIGEIKRRLSFFIADIIIYVEKESAKNLLLGLITGI